MTRNGVSKNPPLTNRGVTLASAGTKPQAAIDYYTCTTPSEKHGLNWMYIFNEHKNRIMSTGSKVTTKRQWGFDLTHIGGLSFGFNDINKMYLLVASSADAQLTWQKVLPTAKNISRIDLALTFRVLGRLTLVEDVWEEVKGNGGKIGYRTIQKSRGGATLYVGSRQSDQYGRFYDKHQESPDAYPEGTYRMEVEFKKPRSKVVFDKLYKAMKSGKNDPKYIADTVVGWFLKRGVDLKLDVGKDAIPATVTKSLTSDKKKARWLRTAVAPTLVDLTGRNEYKLVAEALGLSASDYTQLSLMAPDFGPGLSI